jgi:DNA-binding IclR family transcriptional regulator
VTNVLRLLECFALPEGELPLGELASRTGLSKSTTHRLLQALVNEGYVAQGQSGDYRLGVKLLRFASYARSQSELLRLARPFLESLVASTRETAFLGVLDGIELLYLDTREPDEAVRLARHPGAVGSPHVSSLGKALLAFSPQEIVDRLVNEGLPRHTEWTVTDRDLFLADLEQVRERGYAVNNQERIDGVRAIGFPVFGEGQACVAAISVAGPLQRMSDERIDELVPITGRAATELSALLGHQGDGALRSAEPSRMAVP